MTFTRRDIKDIVKNTPDIKYANAMGVDGNCNTWGMLYADVLVDDTIPIENQRSVAGVIVQTAFPDVHLVAVRVTEEEKGYKSQKVPNKTTVSVIFNITGHKFYDARIHKVLNR